VKQPKNGKKALSAKGAKNVLKTNDFQKIAIKHKSGPLLVVAGAGTGKTRVITERIKNLIEHENALPEEILALTFTEKAANEMLERIGDVMPLGYEEPWVYTFHSFADRVLRAEGLEIGLDPSYKIISTPDQWLLVRKNLFKFELKYFRPLGNPTKFIAAILKFISRIQDENTSVETFSKYVQELEDKDEEKIRWLELAKFYQKYQELKIANSKMDFGDLIMWTIKLFKERPALLKKYQNQFKHILVDEFQDTNHAQYELVKLLYPNGSAKTEIDGNEILGRTPKILQEDIRSLLVVGDDSQCLPPSARVSIPSGFKEIKNIKMGDAVLTAVGKGHTSISKVSKVFMRKRSAKFITFRTEDNKEITITNNHKVFCFLPGHYKSKDYHFVYLMNQESLGWRVGVTNNLPARLRLEHHADRIFALGSFKTDQEARFYESYISAKYGLPTVPFSVRPNQAISGEWLVKLFKDLDTRSNAQTLANDFDLELDSPVFIVDGVTRGASKRVKINLLMCQRNYRSKTHKEGFVGNPNVTHHIHLETSNEEILGILEKNGFSLHNAKKGKRFRFSTQDLSEAWKVAEKLRAITGGFIDKKFKVGRYNHQHLPARIVPASHVFPGMYLPVLVDKHIEYKMVVLREEKTKESETYDLEIERTHNFIADGIVVHNSIYKFRGAAVSNILEFMKDYPSAQMVTLLKNYRSTQRILDPAYKLIKNNNPDTLESKLGISKELVSEISKSGVDINVYQTETGDDEVELVISKILEILATEPQYTYKDFAILARANNHLDAFVLALRKHGLPYQLVGNRGLYDRDEVRDILALLKVIVNPLDGIALYRALNIKTLDVTYAAVTQMLSQSRYKKVDLWELVKNYNDEKVQSFYKTVVDYQENITKATPVEIVYNLVSAINYVRQFLEDETVENQLCIKNLDLFLTKVKGFEVEFRSETKENPTIIDFVDYIELMIDAGENPAQAEIEDIDTINLLTVHASKGLEFPVVFVVNLVGDRFPTREKGDPIPIPDALIKESLPTGDEHIQEERRLFYVGMTRAKKYLFLTLAKNYGGKREKVPSGFVEETGLRIQYVSAGQIKKEGAGGIGGAEGEIQETLFGVGTPFREPEAHKIASSPLSLAGAREKIKEFIPDFLSYSQIDTYLTCPLQYKYAYVLKIPTPPSHSLSFGNTIHDTLRDYHTRLMFGEKINLDQLLEIYRNNWQPLGYLNGEHRQMRFREGEELLRKYYEENKGKTFKHKGLEKTFNMKIDGIKFYGKIDRIDELSNGGVEIIDYKTGKTKNQKDVDKDAQVAFYAIAAKEVFGLDVEKLSYYFVESGEKISTMRTPKQLEEKKKEVVDVIGKMRSGNFEAVSGMHCLWCDYKNICPYAYKG